LCLCCMFVCVYCVFVCVCVFWCVYMCFGVCFHTYVLVCVYCVPASLCGLCIGRVIMYRLCMSVCGMYVHVCGVCMWCIWYVYVSLPLCVCEREREQEREREREREREQERESYVCRVLFCVFGICFVVCMWCIWYVYVSLSLCVCVCVCMRVWCVRLFMVAIL
jgi:small-conductance mechanosensitive channel